MTKNKGSANERRRVYIHYRPIFSGVDAQVRKQKRIKELVDASWASLEPLLQDIGQKRVLRILRSLLDGRIFESEASAKLQFPELFLPSSLLDVQRETAEDSAAKLREEILDSISSHHDEGLDMDDAPDSEPDEHNNPDEQNEPDEHNNPDEQNEPDEHSQVVNLVNGESQVENPAPPNGATNTTPSSLICSGRNGATDAPPSRHKMPSLYPSHLPYQTQHVILTTVQQVLEECCFAFATAAMPSVLEEKKWECAAAAELTQWTRLFRKGKSKLGVQANSIDFSHRMLTGVSQLRHTAVHRVPTTARGISQLLDAAVTLAQTLQDDLRAAQLDEIRRDFDLQIKAMELNKNMLEDTMSAGLQEIQRQRQELDRMEADLIQKTLTDDENNKALVGQLLERSVRRILSGETQAKRTEKQDGNGDEGEDNGDLERGNGKTPDQEENEDDDDTSGYETSSEERLDDGE